MRLQMMAQLRREMSAGEGGHGPQALVAFPDPAQAAAITLTLTRLGYHVETVDDFEDGARLLEQDAYDVVATARLAAAAGRPESLYQRMVRLSPDQRRRLFVILVGDQFKSGDGTQAFLVMADLVLSTREAAAADQLIRGAVAERKRLYQAFDEARKRFEATGA
jgi:CheY-like chemotaxis protein